jgi:hypothetical protein
MEIGVLTSKGWWLALPCRDLGKAIERGVPGVGGNGVDGAETKLISEGELGSTMILLLLLKGVVNGGGWFACCFLLEEEDEPQPTKRLNCCLKLSFFLSVLRDGCCERMIDDEDVGVT